MEDYIRFCNDLLDKTKGNRKIIAVDFDGTIVEHRYPAIGKEKEGAIDTLKRLAKEGNKLILWTVREGDLLDEAVAFCRSRGLEFYAVNSNLPQNELFLSSAKSISGKVSADVYIDDRNLGGIPDWDTIYEQIADIRERKHRGKKKSFLKRILG